MVQILPPRQVITTARKKKFSERLGESVGTGVDAAYRLMEESQQKKFSEKREEKENELLKELTGKDFSGASPEIKKIYLAEMLRGETAQKKERSKFENQIKMMKELGLDQQFEVGPELGESNETSQESGKVPGEMNVKLGSLIPDSKIQKVAAIFPNVANQMSKQNERILSEQQHAENIRQKELQERERLNYQSFKDNKDYTEKVLGGYEGYKREKAVLDQMDKIANKGDLPTPLLIQALGKVGLPLGLLENPDAEQFEKLSQELMKGIQGTYGSRILQSEVQNFMKSIPTLLNSPEGQKRLIQQWKTLNEGKRIYYDAYKNVRNEYPDRLPPDLHEKVLEKADERLDKLANRFGLLAEIPSDYVKTPGTYLVLSPDGEMGEIEADKVEGALKEGYELLE